MPLGGVRGLLGCDRGRVRHAHQHSRAQAPRPVKTLTRLAAGVVCAVLDARDAVAAEVQARRGTAESEPAEPATPGTVAAVVERAGYNAPWSAEVPVGDLPTVPRMGFGFSRAGAHATNRR
jgi:hypothetical protein